MTTDIQPVALAEQRLAFPYGFINEFGVHQFWPAGTLVVDAGDLDLLRRRGAVFVED